MVAEADGAIDLERSLISEISQNKISSGRQVSLDLFRGFIVIIMVSSLRK